MRSWSKIVTSYINNKFLLYFGGIITLFIVDRLSKILSLKFLPDEGIFIIPNITGIILERNQGIAYSIPLSGTYLIITLIIIIFFLVFLAIRAYQRQEIKVIVSLGLIIVGAVSNLFDRLQYGYVIDMFVLTRWPVFNIADVTILIGGVWLIIIYLKKNKSLDLLGEH